MPGFLTSLIDRIGGPRAALIWAVGLTLLGAWAATVPVVKGIAYSIAGFFIIGSFVLMAVGYARSWRASRAARAAATRGSEPGGQEADSPRG